LGARLVYTVLEGLVCAVPEGLVCAVLEGLVSTVPGELVCAVLEGPLEGTPPGRMGGVTSPAHALHADIARGTPAPRPLRCAGLSGVVDHCAAVTSLSGR